MQTIFALLFTVVIFHSRSSTSIPFLLSTSTPGCTPETLESRRKTSDPNQSVEEVTVVESEIRRVVLGNAKDVEIGQNSFANGISRPSEKRSVGRDLHSGSTVKLARSPRRLLTPQTRNETSTTLVDTGPNAEDEVIGVLLIPIRNITTTSDSSSDDDDDDDDSSFEPYHAVILVVGFLIIFITLSSWWFHQRFKKRRLKSKAPFEEAKEASGTEEAPAADQPESSVRHLNQRVIEEMMDVYSHVPLEEAQEKERKQDTPVPPLNLRSASYDYRRTRSLELKVLSSMPNFKMDGSYSTSSES